ncbi:hypothetical protein HYQ84_002374 [Salmonella enterica]|uniref:Hemolysin XhlA n=1 Tax=Salmonella enterica TaxID=28901 RepID=A0A620CYZ6_SALER|nr:hypothetical protein [Salmonella enterica]EDX2020118.1 hypothetical protein [Salmonella enterica subsp. enterica serovar Sandiego]EEJ1464031.1 hypothetical protein [Salmonella enterica subsp. enterica serovar Virginia]EAZ1829238.1 hypothetical protein [Salmonella enterica]ECH2067029.1 hypothetical protein [Salmonella enterica]ECK6141660.1 hypothetical protein [Salmonella enterica]
MAFDYTSGYTSSIVDSVFLNHHAESRRTGFRGVRINKKPRIVASSNPVGDNTMRERVARLEASVDHIQKDIGDIKGTLTSVDTRIKGIEIKMWLGTGILTAGATLLGWLGYVINNYLPQILHAVQIISN